MKSYSPLQQLRMQYQPALPLVLEDLLQLTLVPRIEEKAIPPKIKALFSHTRGNAILTFSKGNTRKHLPKRVGVVLSGGQAAGGHNVIAGLFDALKKLHPESRLFGFYDGPKGIIENKSVEITAEMLVPYRNQGGFDLLGSGRTKIETQQQFEAAELTMRSLKLDGLVIIGGDDSNTNAAFLAEYFLSRQCPTKVIGVPKTIDGDLKNEEVEISFGFDTACKTYSETIGNILRDCLSAKKSYYFIKLMGRSASHIALECALQTHPNMTFIGEEVAEQGKTLQQLTQDICDMICQRSKLGKDFGVILIPEGIIEFIPEFKQLIRELNLLLNNEKPHLHKMSSLAFGEAQISYIASLLSPESAKCFLAIPKELQLQLLMDRDPHGNVQVAKIETERLFIEMVRNELKKRKAAGNYSGSFNAQPHYCGYEGRSCLPSNFDTHYCYALGHVAVLLIDSEATGYICSIQDLAKPVSEWQVGAQSLVTMLDTEERHGKEIPAIRKALVDLSGRTFRQFQEKRDSWITGDDYCYPGPIQFFGPEEITEAITHTLSLESDLQGKL